LEFRRVLFRSRRTAGFEGGRQNRLGSLPTLDEDPALAVVRTLLPGLPGDALPVAEGGLEDQDRVHDRLVGHLSDRAAVLPVQGVALFHLAGRPVQAKLPALDGGLTDDLPLDLITRVQGERGDGVSEQDVVGVHRRTFLLSRAMPQHAVFRSPPRERSRYRPGRKPGQDPHRVPYRTCALSPRGGSWESRNRTGRPGTRGLPESPGLGSRLDLIARYHTGRRVTRSLRFLHSRTRAAALANVHPNEMSTSWTSARPGS